MITPLLERWRDEARLLRKRCCPNQASLIESLVIEAEEFIAQAQHSALTLNEAAHLGGYSKSHLARLVREGKIPNAGRAGAPRIALKDVPRRSVATHRQSPHIDRTQIVRLAINEE